MERKGPLIRKASNLGRFDSSPEEAEDSAQL